MITLSLCMIVKNEEDVLARCLSSVSDIADEIIIVDTGSTDQTKEIAKKFTNKVYDFTWIDDFSAARNFSFSKASMDYILWLDADDVILPEDRKEFLKLKETINPSIDIVMMKYNVGFDETGNVTLSYFRERLIKRSKHFKWLEPVHEYLELGGAISNSNIHITHQKMHPSSSGRNMEIYEKILRAGGKLSPRGLFYYARELFENEKYNEAMFYFTKFLDTKEGWLEDNIRALSDLASCYQIKGDNKNMLKTLIKSFEYDAPRAEICCQIGNYYFEKREYEKAIVWYKIATNLKEPADSWGFLLHDYWGFIPNLQLCVCYDKLRNFKKARSYNEKAAKYKPNDPAVIYNRNYFKSLNQTK